MKRFPMKMVNNSWRRGSVNLACALAGRLPHVLPAVAASAIALTLSPTPASARVSWQRRSPRTRRQMEVDDGKSRGDRG